MKSIEQAKIIYQVCVGYAKRGKYVSYGELLSHLNYKQGTTGNAIRYGLELTWIACAHFKLPILTSIVVSQASRKPNPDGFNVVDWERLASEAFNFVGNWPEVGSLNWGYVWENRRKLSNALGTRGYWG